MSWSLDGTQIVVSKSTNSAAQAIAKLQPLASGTVYHVFGYQDLVKKLTALIVGYPDQLALISMNRDGVTHTLSGAGGYLGEYYVSSIESDMQQVSYQTFLLDDKHTCEMPVFQISLELFKEES